MNAGKMNVIFGKLSILQFTYDLIHSYALNYFVAPANIFLWNTYLGIQLGGVRSTSQVAKSFIGTGFKFTPMLVLPLPEMTNNPEVPKPPLDVLAGGKPPDVGVPVLRLMPPIPPMRLLEAVAELPPDAMADTGLIECPLDKGVLGAPTTLAMIKWPKFYVTLFTQSCLEILKLLLFIYTSLLILNSLQNDYILL